MVGDRRSAAAAARHAAAAAETAAETARAERDALAQRLRGAHAAELEAVRRAAADAAAARGDELHAVVAAQEEELREPSP